MRLAGPFDGGIFTVRIGEVSGAMSGDWAGLNHLDGAIPRFAAKLTGVVLRGPTSGSSEDGLALHCCPDEEESQPDTNPFDGYTDAIPDECDQQGQDDTADAKGDATT